MVKWEDLVTYSNKRTDRRIVVHEFFKIRINDQTIRFYNKLKINPKDLIITLTYKSTNNR